MYNKIEDRIIAEAQYLYENYATLREVAKVFNVSKSTVHKDISYKLKEINMVLYNRAKQVLNYNYNIKHVRGGEANRKKYLK